MAKRLCAASRSRRLRTRRARRDSCRISTAPAAPAKQGAEASSGWSMFGSVTGADADADADAEAADIHDDKDAVVVCVMRGKKLVAMDGPSPANYMQVGRFGRVST